MGAREQFASLLKMLVYTTTTGFSAHHVNIKHSRVSPARCWVVASLTHISKQLLGIVGFFWGVASGSVWVPQSFPKWIKSPRRVAITSWLASTQTST